jgi:Na+-translocating ferredoxin:NAD+ oxidoreductase RNF subunit RnfB
MADNKDNIKKIYELLPHINCGLCGYENCGQFAKAVAEGSASPFGCRQNPWAGHKISEIMGVRIPAFGYQQRSYQYGLRARSRHSTSLKPLRQEVEGLSKRIEDMLNRIDMLAKRKGSTISISQ